MATTIINNHVYDFSSVKLRCDGVEQEDGFEEISYEDSLEGGEFMGMSPVAQADTRGVYKASGSAKCVRITHDAMVQRFGNGFMEKHFEITVSYADSGQPTITDVLENVRISKNAAKNSKGGDPSMVDLDLKICGPGRIKWNGMYGVLKAGES